MYLPVRFYRFDEVKKQYGKPKRRERLAHRHSENAAAKEDGVRREYEKAVGKQRRARCDKARNAKRNHHRFERPTPLIANGR